MKIFPSLLAFLLVLPAPALAQRLNGYSYYAAASGASIDGVAGIWEGGLALRGGSALPLVKPLPGSPFGVDGVVDLTLGYFPMVEEGVSGGNLTLISTTLAGRFYLDSPVRPYVLLGVGYTGFIVSDLHANGYVYTFPNVDDEFTVLYGLGVAMDAGGFKPFAEFRKNHFLGGDGFSMISLGVSF